MQITRGEIVFASLNMLLDGEPQNACCLHPEAIRVRGPIYPTRSSRYQFPRIL